MAHGYQTRSTTTRTVRDYAQGLTCNQISLRSSRRLRLLPIVDSSSSNAQILVEEKTVRKPKSSVQMDQQMNTADDATTLPCLNNSFTGTPELITCAVCFEAMSASREPMATRCGHVFCGGCLAKSLKTRQRCPTCKSTAKLSTSLRLYF